MKRTWGLIKENARSLFIAFLVVLVGVVVFNQMWGDPNLSYAMVAFGTLLLALVTAWSIDNRNQQEKRRMEEDKKIREEEKEYEFKRRCMDDIYEWAKMGATLLTEIQPSYDASQQRENLVSLAPLRAENNWMMNASRQFDEKQLPRIVDEAAENLKQYVEMLEKPTLGGADIHEQCRKSFVKLIEYIANLKVKVQI